MIQPKSIVVDAKAPTARRIPNATFHDATIHDVTFHDATIHRALPHAGITRAFGATPHAVDAFARAIGSSKPTFGDFAFERHPCCTHS